jgi:hypothetical protein
MDRVAVFDFERIGGNRIASRAAGNITSNSETNRGLDYQIEAGQQRQRR